MLAVDRLFAQDGQLGGEDMEKSLDGQLVEAAEQRLPDECRRLLDCGANPNYRSVAHGGRTALAVAVGAWGWEESLACALLLARACDVNVCDDTGMTPLMIAGALGCDDSQLVDLLVEKSALAARDCRGATALVYAASWRAQTAARILDKLDQCGRQAPDVARALRMALRQGKPRCAEVFSPWEKTWVDQRDELGRNLLMNAIEGGDPECVAMTIGLFDLEEVDAKGHSALDIARTAWGKDDSPDKMEGRKAVLDFFLAEFERLALGKELAFSPGEKPSPRL
jgi:hypothetical protein